MCIVHEIIAPCCEGFIRPMTGCKAISRVNTILKAINKINMTRKIPKTVKKSIKCGRFKSFKQFMQNRSPTKPYINLQQQ